MNNDYIMENNIELNQFKNKKSLIIVSLTVKGMPIRKKS